MTRTISAQDFKDACFDILDQLAAHELDQVVITRRGRPVAFLTGPDAEATTSGAIHGFMSGSVIVPEGFDLTAPTCDEPFTAESGRICG